MHPPIPNPLTRHVVMPRVPICYVHTSYVKTRQMFKNKYDLKLDLGLKYIGDNVYIQTKNLELHDGGSMSFENYK